MKIRNTTAREKDFHCGTGMAYAISRALVIRKDTGGKR